MELKPISLKVPVDVLERIDAAASREGLSRTAILLRPFGKDALAQPGVRAPIVPFADTGVAVTKPQRVGPTRRIRGYHPITGAPFYD